MPRMKDLDIDFISLVNKGANKQTVKIYKSDKEPLDSNEEEFRGFFNVLKSFFTKEKQTVKKSEYITDFNTLVGETLIGDRIREARWALMDSLENTLLDSTIADKATHMSTQIDAFKEYVLNTIKTVGIQKSLAQIQEIKKHKEDEDMKPEDIKKMINEALSPIKKEIEELKEEGQPLTNNKGEETDESNTEPSQEEMIAKAIKDATEPLINEIADLKKSRRAPQSLDSNINDGAEVKKSYIGAFESMFN